MNTIERESEASSAEQANELAVQANERADEQMAQYPTGRSTHSAMVPRANIQGLQCLLTQKNLCHIQTNYANDFRILFYWNAMSYNFYIKISAIYDQIFHGQSRSDMKNQFVKKHEFGQVTRFSDSWPTV